MVGFKRQEGFSYMGLLAIIAIAGIGMAGTGIVWHQDAQREGEKELLFVGEQYRRAIASYYESTPGGIKQFPSTLNDLVLDKRFANIKRHIRKLYEDPFYNPNNSKNTANAPTSNLNSTLNPAEPEANKQWGLIIQQSRITGVYSLSTAIPIKKNGFATENVGFDDAARYSDWKFNYAPNSVSLNSAPLNNALPISDTN